MLSECRRSPHAYCRVEAAAALEIVLSTGACFGEVPSPLLRMFLRGLKRVGRRLAPMRIPVRGADDRAQPASPLL